VNAVMIGVGAAFDFHAGTVQRAPPGCATTDWSGCIAWHRSRGDVEALSGDQYVVHPGRGAAVAVGRD